MWLPNQIRIDILRRSKYETETRLFRVTNRCNSDLLYRRIMVIILVYSIFTKQQLTKTLRRLYDVRSKRV